MKIKYFVPGLLILLLGCNGWVPSQEDKFMEECQKAMGNRADGKSVCSCYMERVKEEYTFDQFTSGEHFEETQAMFQECLAQDN